MLPPDLVAKLNECGKHNFIHSRDVWFASLAISTVAVAFGVAGEGAELWYEMKSIARERCDRFRYRILIPEKRLHIAKVVGFVGWFVIVLGVAWEGYNDCAESQRFFMLAAASAATSGPAHAIIMPCL